MSAKDYTLNRNEKAAIIGFLLIAASMITGIYGLPCAPTPVDLEVRVFVVVAAVIGSVLFWPQFILECIKERRANRESKALPESTGKAQIKLVDEIPINRYLHGCDTALIQVIEDATWPAYQAVPVTLEASKFGLAIRIPGHGNTNTVSDPIIMFELCEGEFRLLVWADINSETPTHDISLEGARLRNRKDADQPQEPACERAQP